MQLFSTFSRWRESSEKDRLFAALVIAVAAMFFLLETRLHRDVFYGVFVLPALLLYRPSDFRAVAGLRLWQLSAALALLWVLSELLGGQQRLAVVADEARIAFLLMLFFSIACRLALNERLTLAQVFRWLIPLAAITAFAAIIYNFSQGGEAVERLEGFGRADHPIIGASLFGAIALVAVCFVLTPGRSWLARGGYVLAAAVCVLFMMLTQSRGPVLGLLMALLVIGAFLWRRGVAVILAAIGVVLAVLVLAGAVDLADWLERGSAFRLEIWQQTLTLWLERPWTGYGPEPGHMFHGGGLAFGSPHNAVLAMAYYAGLPALLLFMALLAVAVRAVLHEARRGEPIYLGLLVFALVVMILDTGAIVTNLGREWFIFWLPLAFIAARGNEVRAEAREKSVRPVPDRKKAF